jgi:hypothetical protein
VVGGAGEEGGGGSDGPVGRQASGDDEYSNNEERTRKSSLYTGFGSDFGSDGSGTSIGGGVDRQSSGDENYHASLGTIGIDSVLPQDSDMGRVSSDITGTSPPSERWGGGIGRQASGDDDDEGAEPDRQRDSSRSRFARRSG